MDDCLYMALYNYEIKLLHTFQVVVFTVCHFDIDCDKSSLMYYDGDLRKQPHRYCGLRSLFLPRSNSSIAILDLPSYATLVSEIRIHFRAENADSYLESGVLW